MLTDPQRMQIEPMTAAHSDAALAIYQAGIDEGNATFETQAPGWAEFSAAKLPGHSYVAVVAGDVLGWVAVSAVSDRCVYAGVVEHSVYVYPGARRQGVGRTLLDAPHCLHRGRRDLDHPVRDFPRERRQCSPAHGGRLPRRRNPGARRPASRALAWRPAHRATKPGDG